MKILFIDTETGGVGLRSAEYWSLIQIGAVVWDSENPGGGPSFDRVVNEELSEGGSLRLHTEALAVNGFTEERIRHEGVSPAQATAELLAFLTAHFPGLGKERITVGGHNVAYDVQFMGRLFRMSSPKFGDLTLLYDRLFHYRTIDTCTLARFLIEAKCFPKEIETSSDLLEYFHCAPSKPHDALFDAISTAQLYERMLDYVKAGGLAERVSVGQTNSSNVVMRYTPKL